MWRLQRALDAVRGHPRVADAALAVLLAALVQWEILTTAVTGSKWLLMPAGLAMTIPLAWRRVAPLPALLFVMAGGLFYGTVRYSTGSVLLTMIFHAVGNAYAAYQRLHSSR